MNNKNQPSPKTFEDILLIVSALLTQEDIDCLKKESLEMATARLHLTLGYRIRATLGLWREESYPIIDLIQDSVPDTLAFEADSASDALITYLWKEHRNLI